MPRPNVGLPINIRLGPIIQDLVDDWANQEGLTRAEAVRVLLTLALHRELLADKTYPRWGK